jgi:hypothetical protein
MDLPFAVTALAGSTYITLERGKPELGRSSSKYSTAQTRPRACIAFVLLELGHGGVGAVYASPLTFHRFESKTGEFK